MGGCIRDAILGREISDFDITTNALPHQIIDACESAGAKTYQTGIKHGTISVVFPDNDKGETIEVTTYRTDGKYRDSRHPENVEFVKSIDEDLKRRDFTMNAICYNPTCGIYDPLNGVNDIENQVIRAIGDAKKRFSEDALRILRAARFASQLGFSICDDTYKNMKIKKSKLLDISAERITYELDLMLRSEHVHDAIMQCHDVFDCVIPEISACAGFDQHTKYHAYDVLEHIAFVTQYVKNTQTLRWAALLHDIGKPATFFLDEHGQGHFYGHAVTSQMLAKNVLSRMKLDSKVKDNILTLIQRHNDTLTPTKKCINKTICMMNGNVALFRDLLELKRADSLGHAPNYTAQVHIYDEIEELLFYMIADHAIFKESQLAINGNDLIETGIKIGPNIKDIKHKLLIAVMNEQVANEKEELVKFVNRIK